MEPSNEKTAQEKTSRKRSWPFRLLRFWSGLLLVLTLLFLALMLLLRIPAVQNWAVDQVASYLSSELNTTVQVDEVAIDFFDRVEFNGFLLLDQQNDTLAYVDHLEADIHLLQLVRGVVEVEELTLDGADILLQKQLGADRFNHQFLIDYFSPQKDPSDDKKKKMQILADAVYLSDISFRLDNQPSAFLLYAGLPSATIKISSIDLDSSRFVLDQLILNEPDIRLLQGKKTNVAVDSVTKHIVEQVIDSTYIAPYFSIQTARINKGHFVLENFNVGKQPDRMLDFADLDISDIAINIDDLVHSEGTTEGIVNMIRAQEKRGFDLEELSAQSASVGPRGILLYGLNLETPRSSVSDTLTMTYKSWSAFKTFADDVRLDARFKNGRVAVEDIAAFAPTIYRSSFFKSHKDDSFLVNGRIYGKVNRLIGKNVSAQLGQLRFKGTARTRDLTSPDDLFLDLDVKKLAIPSDDLKKIIGNAKLPPSIQKLGILNFSGEFIGFPIDFVLNGTLRSDIGLARIDDMRLDLKSAGRELGTYSGGLAVENFDLAAWTGNTEFGNLSFSGRFKGKGLSPKTLNAKLDGVAQEFTFKNYTYQNIVIDGSFDKGFFEGAASIDDDNVAFNFEGLIDFTDSIPVFDLTAQLDTLNLKALNLLDRDLRIDGTFKLDFEGNTIDNFIGSAFASELQVYRDTFSLSLDSILLVSKLLPVGRSLSLSSDLAQAELKGEFDILLFPRAFLQFFEKNYPNYAKRLNINPNKTIRDTLYDGSVIVRQVAADPVPPQDVSFDIQIKEATSLLTLFPTGQLESIRDAKAVGNFNSRTSQFLIGAEVGALKIAGVEIDSIYLNGENDGRLFKANLGTAYAIIGDSSLVLPSAEIQANVVNDSIEFGLNIANVTNFVSDINLKGEFTLFENLFQLRLDSSAVDIYGDRWIVSNDNYIRFGNKTIETRNFELSNQGGQSLIVSSTKDKKGLKLKVDNFTLDLLNDFIIDKNYYFSADLSANAMAANIFDLKGINAQVRLDSFHFQETNYGLLTINSEVSSIDKPIPLLLNLSKGDSRLNGRGMFYTAKAATVGHPANSFELDVSIKKYPFSILEHFLPKDISRTTGHLDANVELFGDLKKQNIAGTAKLTDASLLVNLLGVTYTISNDVAVINNQWFDFSAFTLSDSLGNVATMSPIQKGIRHENLRNFRLDALLRTDQIVGLSTTKEDNELFYGYGLGAAVVEAVGPFNQVDLNVTATSRAGSYISIPVSSTVETKEVNFITFIDRDALSDSTLLEEAGPTKIRGVNLDLSLDINPLAEVSIIFDEQTGDIIRGRGNGDIRIQSTRFGDFLIDGQFEITSGNYLFTYQEFIKKPFTVKPGGTISWSGDPYNADIAIEAYYDKLNTSPYNFILEFLTTTEEEQLAKRATQVNLEMILKGKLLQPDISFDIDFPSLDVALSGYVESKLRIVQQDKNELNQQVFGLIVLGNFIPSGASSSLANTNPVDIGVNTLSEVLSTQLSTYLTDLLQEAVSEFGFISDINFDIGYNRYDLASLEDPTTSETGGELNLLLQNSFVNNRLIVSIGGNIDVGGTNTSATGGAFVAGDFSIEYKITPDGRFSIKAYQSLDEGLEGRENRTGIGLSYKRQFDTFDEFIEGVKSSFRPKKRRMKIRQ